jgi:copper chaperone CopZ
VSFNITLSIPDIACGRCVMKVERVTRELPGVLAVQADSDTKTATYLLESETALDGIKQILAEAGFPAAA